MPEYQQKQLSKNLEPSSLRQTTSSKQTYVSNPAAIIQRARIDPKSLTSADVLLLQRSIGNRAVGRLISEIERHPSTAQQAPIQRQEIPEEEEPLQGAFEKKNDQSTCPSCSTSSVLQKEGNLTGMPDNLKAGVENLSGIDMSDVRVHYNSSKPAEIGALAYTQGTNIHVAPGQERHLPHEAWHVVQQAQGRVKPTMQLKGMAINNDVGLEHEADSIGTSILQMKILEEKSSNQNHGIATTSSQRKSNFKKVNVIQRWAEAEHVKIGDKATVELLKNLKKYSVESYGKLNSIAGDFVKTPNEIFERFNRIMKGFIGFKISLTNENHFFPLASREWRTHHNKAREKAKDFSKDKNEDSMVNALKEEAFAAHFLQDSYASGHQYPRALASITGSGLREDLRSWTYHDALNKLDNGLPLIEGRFHGDNKANDRDIELLSIETKNSLQEVFHDARILLIPHAGIPKPSEGPDVFEILKDEKAGPIWEKMMGSTRKIIKDQRKLVKNRGLDLGEEFYTDGGTDFDRGEIIRACEEIDPENIHIDYI